MDGWKRSIDSLLIHIESWTYVSQKKKKKKIALLPCLLLANGHLFGPFSVPLVTGTDKHERQRLNVSFR